MGRGRAAGGAGGAASAGAAQEGRAGWAGPLWLGEISGVGHRAVLPKKPNPGNLVFSAPKSQF